MLLYQYIVLEKTGQPQETLCFSQCTLHLNSWIECQMKCMENPQLKSNNLGVTVEISCPAQSLPHKCTDRSGWCDSSNPAPAVASQIMASQLADSVFGFMSSWSQNSLGIVTKKAQSPATMEANEKYIRKHGEPGSVFCFMFTRQSCAAPAIFNCRLAPLVGSGPRFVHKIACCFAFRFIFLIASGLHCLPSAPPHSWQKIVLQKLRNTRNHEAF